MHLNTLCLGLLEITVATGHDIKQMFVHSLSHVCMESSHSSQRQTLQGLVAQPAGQDTRCTIESAIAATRPGRNFIRSHRQQPPDSRYNRMSAGQSGPPREETL